MFITALGGRTLRRHIDSGLFMRLAQSQYKNRRFGVGWKGTSDPYSARYCEGHIRFRIAGRKRYSEMGRKFLAEPRKYNGDSRIVGLKIWWFRSRHIIFAVQWRWWAKSDIRQYLYNLKRYRASDYLEASIIATIFASQFRGVSNVRLYR